jgi:hypothetical protein
MSLDLLPILGKVRELYDFASASAREGKTSVVIAALLLPLIEKWNPQHNGKAVLDAEAKNALAVLVSKLACSLR